MEKKRVNAFIFLNLYYDATKSCPNARKGCFSMFYFAYVIAHAFFSWLQNLTNAPVIPV